MEMGIACILSFLCGMACTLTAQVLGVSNADKTAKVQKEVEKPKLNHREEKLREQWDNFLSYNGNEQNGGDI